MRRLIVLTTALVAAITVNAQTCPSDDNGSGKALRPSVLHGTLQLHDELRQWLGIKLDQPACGQAEIELVFSKTAKSREAKALRGCTVMATGTLFDSPTGYYSADMAISDAILKPDPSCHQFPVEQDPYAVPIPPTVKSYRASISVDYRGKGHIDVKVWQGVDKAVLLVPWQAYISYTLTGGREVIWFDCPKEFHIEDISQTPENPDGILRDAPYLTGAALQDINGINVVKFACRKKSEGANLKLKSSQLNPK